MFHCLIYQFIFNCIFQMLGGFLASALTNLSFGGNIWAFLGFGCIPRGRLFFGNAFPFLSIYKTCVRLCPSSCISSELVQNFFAPVYPFPNLSIHTFVTVTILKLTLFACHSSNPKIRGPLHCLPNRDQCWSSAFGSARPSSLPPASCLWHIQLMSHIIFFAVPTSHLSHFRGLCSQPQMLAPHFPVLNVLDKCR